MNQPAQLTLEQLAERLDDVRTELFVGSGRLEPIVRKLIDLNRALVAELQRREADPQPKRLTGFAAVID